MLASARAAALATPARLAALVLRTRAEEMFKEQEMADMTSRAWGSGGAGHLVAWTRRATCHQSAT